MMDLPVFVKWAEVKGAEVTEGFCLAGAGTVGNLVAAGLLAGRSTGNKFAGGTTPLPQMQLKADDHPLGVGETASPQPQVGEQGHIGDGQKQQHEQVCVIHKSISPLSRFI